jgi:ComF family protein
MSMLDDIVESYHDIRSLIFAECCMVCGCHVTRSMHNICPRCRLDIPLTNYWLKEDNPAKERFDGLLPVTHGSAFFFYKGNSLWRTLIHRFKYGGLWQMAYNLGRWYGAELKASTLYDDIDIIIPLPLHPIKSIKRGYNQSRYLADGIAKELGVEVESRAVRRTRNNPSQARLKRRERWEGVDDLFSVVKPERLRGKHILVVDDVMTSGATLYSCMQTILAAVPDARISFATLAVTGHITPL